MARPSVIVDGVWKKFRRGERHDSLRDLIPSLARRAFARDQSTQLTDDEFWALRDLSFEVSPGEALGIIGPNGAGKSTVLKLLTRILKPTRGRCEVHGRVGAMIEVAAGFHPDLTGRENLYLQGAIMGMKQAEITRRFSDIVEFSGVGPFIDTPVKRYSSGMNARLGFAIVAHLDPQVLLIDEVLSVGDAAFQERCLAHLRRLRADGVALVFVSHNLIAVLELCTRAIVIDQGRVLCDGEPAAAIHDYRSARWSAAESGAAADAPIRIRGVRVLDERARPLQAIRTGANVTIRIQYEALQPIDEPHFAVDIVRGDGVYCYGTNTRLDHRQFEPISGRGHVDLVIPQLFLLPGCYSFSIGILGPHGFEPYDVQHHAYPFSVVSEHRDLGLVYLPHSWQAPQGEIDRLSSVAPIEKEQAVL